jgi:hypothetical protein
MQEHMVGVGDELVIEGVTRLTILAVEAGEVLLAITACEPGDGGDPEARQRPLRMTARPVRLASDN